jgi:hypothetical protein
MGTEQEERRREALVSVSEEVVAIVPSQYALT